MTARPHQRSRIDVARLLRHNAVLLFYISMCVVFALLSARFLTVRNVTNVLQQVSMIGIITMGMTLLLVSGNFDLSVGGIVALVGVFMAQLANGPGLAVAIVAAVLIGAALGAINGVIVVLVRINSLIATLGTGLVYAGFAFIVAGGEPVTMTSTRLTNFTISKAIGVPVPVWIFAGVITLAALFLHGTVGGQQLYAVGGNRDAARYAGVRTALITFIPFVVTGAFCGVAAIILTGLLGSGLPDAAQAWPLEVIAAAVVGGVSILGGVGTIFMAVLGVLLIGTVDNGMNLVGLDPNWQNIFTGAILIAAVGADQLLRRYSGTRARATPEAGTDETGAPADPTVQAAGRSH